MLEYAFDITAATRALTSFPDVLDRQRPRWLGEIGRQMEERARTDFLIKSRGGTGAGGITWKQVTLTEQRRKQRVGAPALGVRTQELLKSLTHTVGPGATAWGKPLVTGEVAIEFTDQPKANAFNAERPLFPTRLPAEWYRAAEALTQAAVDQVADTLFPKG